MKKLTKYLILSSLLISGVATAWVTGVVNPPPHKTPVKVTVFPPIIFPPAEGAPCRPLYDDCMPGLTCRATGASAGICRVVGPGVEGSPCDESNKCGYAMICAQWPDGRDHCSTICDMDRPTLRCGSQQCLRFIPNTNFGICTPQ